MCSMKSKDPGVAGATVEVKVGGNKGREMTGQIGGLRGGLYFCSKSKEVGAMEDSK